jgi:hypothetical protein
MYAAGTGLQIGLQVEVANGSKPRDTCMFLSACIYMCQGVQVAPKQPFSPIGSSLKLQASGTAQPRIILHACATLHTDWGMAQAVKASSMSDLQPHWLTGTLSWLPGLRSFTEEGAQV